MCVRYIVRVSADVAFHTTLYGRRGSAPQYKPMHSINTRAPTSFSLYCSHCSYGCVSQNIYSGSRTESKQDLMVMDSIKVYIAACPCKYIFNK